MKWNLRLAAANRGIWKASELQRMLADHGLSISTGKMSGLWSGDPASIKLSDLDVICAVLGCGVEELLIPQPAGETGRRATGPAGRGVLVAGRAAGDAQAPGRTIAPAGLRCRPEDPVTAPPAASTALPGASWAPAAARHAEYGGTTTRANSSVQDAAGCSRSRTAIAGCAGSRPAANPSSPAGCREERSRFCRPARSAATSCSPAG